MSFSASYDRLAALYNFPGYDISFANALPDSRGCVRGLVPISAARVSSFDPVLFDADYVKSRKEFLRGFSRSSRRLIREVCPLLASTS